MTFTALASSNLAPAPTKQVLKKGGGLSATTIWTAAGEFITNLFSTGGNVITSILGNTVLATLVIGIPVGSLVMGKILKLGHIRRKR